MLVQQVAISCEEVQQARCIAKHNKHSPASVALPVCYDMCHRYFAVS
jgi:hypothetical protein